MIGNPLSDTIQNLLLSRITMLMLLEKYLIKKDNPRSSLCFGCLPRCFLLINTGLTSLMKVFDHPLPRRCMKPEFTSDGTDDDDETNHDGFLHDDAADDDDDDYSQARPPDPPERWHW